MKTILAAAALTLISAFSASAIEFQTPVTRPLYTCATSGVSRVAMPAVTEPCCDGQLKCPQFLSTTGVLQAQRHRRT